jgi:hypothetical protein
MFINIIFYDNSDILNILSSCYSLLVYTYHTEPYSEVSSGENQLTLTKELYHKAAHKLRIGTKGSQ